MQPSHDSAFSLPLAVRANDFAPVATTGARRVDPLQFIPDAAGMSLARKHRKVSAAAAEAAALKVAFRRQDEALNRAGRGSEILADRMRFLGITKQSKSRLVEVDGIKL